MTLNIRTSAFENNTLIPRKYSAEGENLSPPLVWEFVPPETKELALLCEDPDAPQDEPFVHWLIYSIPPSVEHLPEGIGREGETIDAPDLKARQGKNSWGKTAYGGPLPPVGDNFHQYHFRLYALKDKLDLPPGAEKKQFMQAIEDLVLTEADLVGRYRREKSKAS